MTRSTNNAQHSTYHTGTFGEIKKLATIIKPQHLAEPAEHPEVPFIPFKGLDPYVEADASIFFGRKNDIQKVVNSLLAWRLTILYGQSGVGKSSLLRAGVTNALNDKAKRNINDYAGIPKLAVVVFPPIVEGISMPWFDKPLTGLMNQIEKTIAQNDWGIQPPESGLPFVKTLKGWTEALGGEDEDGELYIILDQFEEYFLYHLEENAQDSFAVELLRAINTSDLRVNFLISIRDDSFIKLDRFKGCISNDHTVCIEHLDRQSAREAIEEPIKFYNSGQNLPNLVEITSELIEAVLEGVSRPLSTVAGLGGIDNRTSPIKAPYLQLVMTCLWKKMNDTFSFCLDLEMLIDFAGEETRESEKNRTAVKNIVQKHIETVLTSLCLDEQDIAASVFRYLVTPSGTKYAYSVSELYDNCMSDLGEKFKWKESDISSLLEKLTNSENRIICPIPSPSNQLSQAKHYEIFHDVIGQPILDWRERYVGLKWREQKQREDQQKVKNEIMHIEKEKIRLDEENIRLGKEIMGRIVIIKKGLPTQSLQQQRFRQGELAALLARQAYHFNDQDKLLVLDRVDDALRQILSVPYFSNILVKQRESAFSAITFSSDGSKLAAASLDGKIYLWDREQPYLESKLLNDYESSDHGREKEVHSIAFSPDGHWLASANLSQKTIRLWDLLQEAPVCTEIGQHDAGVTCLAFSPDGNLLASGSEDQTVKLWYWQQPDRDPIVLKEYILKGQKVQMGSVCSLVFSPDRSLDGSKLPDSSKLAVGCDDRSIWIWDVQEPAQTPDREPIVRYGHEERVCSVAFSSNGQTLASASDDRTIRLWDLSRHQAVPQVLQEHTERVRTLMFSPDGKMLTSASDDQTIRLWDTHQSEKGLQVEKVPQVLRGHTFDITSVAFSPDSQFLASGGWDNTVRLWDLYPSIAQPKILPAGHEGKVHSIAISSQDQPDQLIASGSEDETVRVWVRNANKPDAAPKIFQVFKRCGKVFGVALFVSPDRQIQLLAAGSADNIIRLWDLQQPPDHQLRELRGHTDGVSSVAFSPDGKWLASGSWKIDRTVRLWNLDQPDAESIPFTGEGHTESVTSVTFSPDGKTLASASDDKTVRLWQVDQPHAAPTILRNHNGRVWSIAISPDGKLLASASDDWEIRLWNLENLDRDPPTHVPLKGHSAWVSSVAFSPDGQTLASGSFDRSIRLWRINQIDWKACEIKEKPIVLENHNQSITSVAFTPDGKYLASGSYDNTVRLWLASTETLAEMVCKKVSRNLTGEEWKEFMGNDIPYESTCPNLPSGEGMPAAL